MTKQTTEFIVDYLVSGESGRITVIGRCGDEPIQIGDVFDAVFRYKHRRYPDELGLEPVREVEWPASLRVESISAYEQSLDELGQGMTGSLVVSGEGMAQVSPGWVLGAQNGASFRSTESNGTHA
jgi:hypothetical protein